MPDVEHDDLCEQEFINPPGAYGPCGCADRRAAEVEAEVAYQAEVYDEWRSQQQ